MAHERQIMTIPRLSERVECMLYRRKLEVEVEEVRPELNIVRNASQELRGSPRFRRVLQVNSLSQYVTVLLMPCYRLC